MEEEALRSELDQVTSQLSAARTEYAILATRIVGLEASHAALSKALSESESASAREAIDRTDAIVGVLRDAGKEMSISEVVEVLQGDGHAHVTRDSVVADLILLAAHGQVTQVRSGVYGLPE